MPCNHFSDLKCQKTCSVTSAKTTNVIRKDEQLLFPVKERGPMTNILPGQTCLVVVVVVVVIII